jgi:hypothetical protein
VIEGCKIGVEIGGGVTCSNFTVKDSVFSAATGQDSTCIRLSGEGKTLELKRLMFDHVIFDGFSRGLKVGDDVQIGDTLKIINSDFAGAQNQLDGNGGKVKIDGIALA